nr:hypothetical protein [Angustibacter aerolatus]
MPRPTARRAALLQRLWVLDQESSLETALFHADAAAAMGLGVTDTKALGILQRDGAQTAGQARRPAGGDVGCGHRRRRPARGPRARPPRHRPGGRAPGAGAGGGAADRRRVAVRGDRRGVQRAVRALLRGADRVPGAAHRGLLALLREARAGLAAP